MSAEVAPYDPAKLMDSVRDRIKSEFVALIPEDAWKKMVVERSGEILANVLGTGIQNTLSDIRHRMG